MRRFLPREHGLIAWVGLPVLAVLALAPGLASTLAGLAVLAAFGAFNAARREEDLSAAGALLVSAALAVAALLESARPTLLLLGLGLGAAFAVGAMACFRRQLPRSPPQEVGALFGLNALGACLAVSAGAEPERALTVALMLLAWQVTGLWWVRRTMAAVLPRRAPWREGLAVALGLAGSAALAGCWYGLLAIPAVLLLYPLRILAHRPPASPSEAARVGLAELGWSVLALGLAVLASA